MAYYELSKTAPALGMGNMFESAAAGWGPFTTLVKREERKQAKDLARVAAAQEAERRKWAVEDAQRKRVEELRDRRIAQIQSAIREAQSKATSALNLVMKLRDQVAASSLPSSSAQTAFVQLAEWEPQLVAVNVSAGSVNPFAEDPLEQQTILAELQAGAQAALLIHSQARILQRSIEDELRKAKEEELRLDRLLKQRKALEVQERARIESLARQRASQQRVATITAESRLREQQIAFERELEIERAALERAKAELSALQRQAALVSQLRAS